MVHNIHSAFIQMLCNLTEKLRYKWKNSLNKLKFAFNSIRHSATGFTPHFCYLKGNPIYQSMSSYNNIMIKLMESSLITTGTYDNRKIEGHRLSKLQMIVQRRLEMLAKAKQIRKERSNDWK